MKPENKEATATAPDDWLQHLRALSSPGSVLTRREFLRTSLGFAAGAALLSCEESSTTTAEPGDSSPGSLPGGYPSKRIIIIGAGLAGLVAAYELLLAGHDVTILEARNRIGGRVFTLRSPFSDGHFAETGAARIPPNHGLTLAYVEHFGLTLDPVYPASGLYAELSAGRRSLIPAAVFLEDRPWPDSVKYKEYRKIRGGMGKFAQAFAEALENHIRLNSPVESVEQDADGVTVRNMSGVEFTADVVLCTVPLPVLNRIQFTPALSAEKVDAASGGYTYAPSTKVFLECNPRFWEAEKLNGWGKSDWPEEIWHPTWDRDKTSGVLYSYLSWQRASEIDPLSENDRIQSVLNRWETVFPGVKGHVSLGTSFSWNQQEWTGGAYAWPSPAQDARLSSSLGKAEGRIHFAGEHASENHGWMQGALSSGLRAAREMHVYAQAS